MSLSLQHHITRLVAQSQPCLSLPRPLSVFCPSFPAAEFCLPTFSSGVLWRTTGGIFALFLKYFYELVFWNCFLLFFEYFFLN